MVDSDRPFSCLVCKQVFTYKSSLIRHLKNIHLNKRENKGEKLYYCDICMKGFTQKYSLTPHFRVHSGEKAFTCSFCQRPFARKGDLNSHLKQHMTQSREKPYNCEICKKGFTKRGSLIPHLRVHSGEKPYNCTFCQNSFAQKNNLTRHLQMHYNDLMRPPRVIIDKPKPFECDTCEKRFSTKQLLTCHFRIHSGEKPFNCTSCTKTFTQICNLKRHELRAHSQKLFTQKGIIYLKNAPSKQKGILAPRAESSSHSKNHGNERQSLITQDVNIAEDKIEGNTSNGCFAVRVKQELVDDVQPTDAFHDVVIKEEEIEFEVEISRI